MLSHELTEQWIVIQSKINEAIRTENWKVIDSITDESTLLIKTAIKNGLLDEISGLVSRVFLSMTLKLLLVDVGEQVCMDTGIEIEYDFDMLSINVSEDTSLFEGTKYHKKTQYRLIVQGADGKLIIDDADEDEEVCDSEGNL